MVLIMLRANGAEGVNLVTNSNLASCFLFSYSCAQKNNQEI